MGMGMPGRPATGGGGGVDRRGCIGMPSPCCVTGGGGMG
jgi:hypothetical protein